MRSGNTNAPDRRPGAGGASRAPQRKRRLRRGGIIGALVAAIATVMAIAAPAASAAPWSCNAFGYLFQQETAATSPVVQQVDLATGEFTTIGGTVDPVNAVAFDPVNNNVYGWDVTKHEIVRVESDLSLVSLGVPAGVDATVTYNLGDVDAEGHYWMQNGGTGTWYEIDLNAATPTVIKTGTAPPPAGFVRGADWASIGGFLYKVANETTTHVPHLFRFDPATGLEEDVTPGGLGFTATNPANGLADGSGAVYADAAGFLYASFNGSGDIYRIDPKTDESLFVTHGPKANGNDGARCALAPIPTVTVTKSVEGRVRSADQFKVALLKPDGTEGTSVTTSGGSTSATTTNFPVSEGKTYTITDAMAAGSKSQLGEYVKSIECKNAAGTVVPTGGSGPSWTLVIGEATEYTCNVRNKAEADLALSKTSAPTPIVPGEEATFTLTVKNNGPSGSVGETITDPLPSQFTFGSASQGCTDANGTVTCAVGELGPGASKSFEIKGTAAGSLKHCLENTATVSGANDPNMSNNKATACGQLEGKADLSITKTPAANEVKVGGQIMYTLVVKNKGPSDATGVKVEDAMPKGLTLVSADPSQGFCSTAGGDVFCGLGHLVAGGTAQVLVTANAGQTPGAITNKAKVGGDQVDPKPENNEGGTTVTVTPGPPPTFDLTVAKTANVKHPTVGQKVTYTIHVTDNGPDAAPDTMVTDTLNTRARVISVKPETGTCTAKLPIHCELGTVQPGQTVKIKIVAEPAEVGKRKRNAASVTGSGNDPNPANNLDVLGFNVAKVKLKLTKVASRSRVHPGQSFSYLIRVKNITRGIAKKVRVCDRLPGGLAFLGSHPKGRLAKGRLCWRIHRLGPKATKKFTVVVRALHASGTKVNHVTATGAAVAAAKARSAVHVAPAPPKPTPVTG